MTDSYYYSSVHRFLLRSVASRGVLSLAETKRILCEFGETEVCVQDLVKEINDEIRPYKQTIKVTTDELTNEQVLIFLSLGYDDATKAQGIFTANELEYYRILLEQIITTESRQITGIHAMNLVGNMKSSFTKADAQRLLDKWCRMKYLDKDQSNYALGVRAIHEFESYFRQNMPDTIEECCLCKQIVFRGYNCPACALAVHTRCLNTYLEKIQKWPCCKANFSNSQLEKLNSEGSRNTHTQRVDESSEVYNTQVIENTQESSVDDMEISQQLIPEISQRVTKKRKRHND